MKNSLFIKKTGQGPNLVLLHGWGLHGDIFEPVLHLFEEYFQVHVLDLPGFGRSVCDNETYDLDYVLKKVLDVVPNNAYYLGWSLGGMLGMALAIRFPKKVKGLISVAATPRFIKSEDWPTAMQAETLDGFQQQLVEDFRGTLIRFLAIQTLGSQTQQQDIQYLKDITFRFGEPAPKALSGGLEILHQTDLRDGLQNIKCPWLQLYGKNDSIVPAKALDAIASLHPKSHQHLFNRASHAPFISHPHDFFHICKNFLEMLQEADENETLNQAEHSN